MNTDKKTICQGFTTIVDRIRDHLLRRELRRFIYRTIDQNGKSSSVDSAMHVLDTLKGVS